MSDEQRPDPRLVWIGEAPGRKVVNIIEPAPDGAGIRWSVTTQWFENDKLLRQDCEIAIRRGPSSTGGAAGFIKRLLGKG